MIKVRITGNPLAEGETSLHLLRELFKVLKSGRQSTTVEFHVQAPRSSEVASYRFRMSYVSSTTHPKGKQR